MPASYNNKDTEFLDNEPSLAGRDFLNGRSKDNGIGLPYEIINGSKDSSGIFLIKTLANKIDGNVKIENKPVTVYEIEFCGLRPHIYKKTEKNYDQAPNNANPQKRNNTFIPFTMMF